MTSDHAQRLLEIAAELERGQAVQPLADYIAETAGEYARANRAILVIHSEAPAFPVAHDPSAKAVRRVALPGAAWDWLQVTDPVRALNDLGDWSRLVAFSPLVIVWVEAPATLATLRPLVDALAAARKRCVVLALCDLPSTALPAGVPVVRVAGFDPAADWLQTLPKSPPADWSDHLTAWQETFAVERAALPLLGRFEQLRQRTQLHRAINEQRQAALMSQRDLSSMRGVVDKARDAFQLSLDNVEKDLTEGSRLFLVANGEGSSQLKNLVDQLGGDVVREEQRPKAIVLTVDEARMERVVQRLEEMFTANARRIADKADQVLAGAVADFGAELRRAMPDSIPPAAARFDPERLRKAIATMLHTNITYRGELPVKGFFERIQASRQIVFLIIGLLSLAGASAIVRNPLVILITLAIFSVMLFKTTRDFREEAAVARERELQRLHDLLRAHLRQQLQELEAVRINLWHDHLQGVRRAAAAALDQGLRDTTTRQARELDEERQRIQLKQRTLDKTQRDLLGLEQRVQAILTPLRTSGFKAEQTVTSAFRR